MSRPPTSWRAPRIGVKLRLSVSCPCERLHASCVTQSPNPSNEMSRSIFSVAPSEEASRNRTGRWPFAAAGRLGLIISAIGAFYSGRSEPAAQTNAAPPAWLTQPMAIVDAVNIALDNNAAVLKARDDLEAAHGVAIQTRAVALPRLIGTSEYEHNELQEILKLGSTNGIVPPKDEWGGNIRLVQTIYEGGRLRAALRAARLTQEQALMQYQAVVADALLDVRTAYFDVLLAEQQIVVQDASVKLLTEELENTRRRFDAGTVPRFDVLRAEVEVANARPKLIRARNSFYVAKTGLATVLGYDVPSDVPADIPLNLTGKLEAEPYEIQLPGALAQAHSRRPELAALRKASGLRKEQIAIARSGYTPKLEVFGGYGARNSRFREEFFQDIAGANAGVELSWSIFDGRLTRGRVLEAKALYDKAKVELADKIRRVEQEVRTTYSGFLEAREVLESQKKVQEEAEEALRLATARYDAGTSTQLDVLNAQTALTEARTTQVQALHDYAVARARLEHAIGQDVSLETGRSSGK